METTHLQPDFDPSSARAADLRGYFIEHSVPYPSNAKKGELVALYEAHIRPYAATWLRERERARASSAGIEDHRGAVGAATNDAAPAPKKRGRPPKSASMNNLASIASTKPSAAPGRRSSALPTSASATSLAGPRRTGMRRSASVEIVQDSQDDADDDEERAIEGDSDVPVPVAVVPAPKRRGRPPKKSIVQQMEQLQEEEAPMPMEIDGEEDQPVISSRSSVFKPYVAVPPATASVQRRSSSGILSPGGRSATVEVVIPSRRKTVGGEVFESGQKRKAKTEDSVAESGFSDYNPFQSGDDASPDGEKKKRRRKSSLGTAIGGPDEGNPSTGGLGSMKRSSTMGALSSARKSIGGSNAAEDVSTPSVSGIKKSASQHTLSAKPKRDFEGVVPPVPSLPSAYTPQAQQPPPATKSSGSGTSSSKAVPSFQRHAAPFESMKTPPEDFKLLVQQAEQSASSSTRKSSGRRSDPSSALIMKDAAPSAFVPELSDEAQDALHSLGAEPMLEGYSGYQDQADDDDIVVKSSRPPSPRKVSPPKQQQVQQRGPAPPGLNRLQSSDIAVVSPAKQEAANAIAIRRVKPAVPGAVQLVGLLLPLLTLLGGYASYWAEETRSLGFCDTETITNSAVVARRGRFDHPGVSATTSPEDGFHIDWPALGKDVIKTVTPETCSPCPPHAECADGAVKACKRDYILQPNALAYLFGDGLDPKSSVTSILFKPSCRPDTERLVRVAETASQIAKYLRTHRGDIMCGGEERLRRKAAKKDRSGNPEEWAVYGASEDFTKKVIKEVRNPKISESQFDEIFEEALQDLIGHSEVIYGIDADAEPWVAARTAEMALSCRTRLAAYRAADEHKASLASVLSVLLAALYGRVKLAQKKRIAEQVNELVPVALALLQQQDQNHALDPTLHPYSYLAPSQLRDLVLQAEHSPTRRAELWKRVEQIVEGNSNVRAKVEEQYGEDIRVWQWVGGAYYIEEGVDQDEGQDGGDEQPARRRKSYGGLGPRPSLSRPGTPRVNTPGRHITWSKDVKGSPLGTPM